MVGLVTREDCGIYGANTFIRTLFYAPIVLVKLLLLIMLIAFKAFIACYLVHFIIRLATILLRCTFSYIIDFIYVSYGSKYDLVFIFA